MDNITDARGGGVISGGLGLANTEDGAKSARIVLNNRELNIITISPELKRYLKIYKQGRHVTNKTKVL